MLRTTALATAALLLSTTAVLAAPSKTYQVTGPVTALDDTKMQVEKDGEKWEISRGDAALPEGVKVGSKVTVEYFMTASKITSKDTPKKDDAAKEDSKKDRVKKEEHSKAEPKKK